MKRLARTCVAIVAAGLTLASGSTWGQAEGGPPALKVGDKVPAITAPNAADERSRTVDYPKGHATVLLLFLPDCSHCHKMIPEWNREFGRKPPSVDVVGLMMGPEPPGFFQVFPIAFPVLRYSGRDAQSAFKLTKVPMMVRVGPGGVVQDVAHGVIDPIRLGEIFKP